MRSTKLTALSPTQEGQGKKVNQNEIREKELNQIYRQASVNQVKPATSQQSTYQSGQNGQLATGLLSQNSQQKLFQQPQSAQAIRNYSVNKNSNQQADMKMSVSQMKQLGQENLLNAISINNNVMNSSQQMQGALGIKNGKMQKSQSLQKGVRVKPQTGSLKSLKHLQIISGNNTKSGSDNNENAENENGIEKSSQFHMGNSNANILNIQFNPSTTLNRNSDYDSEMKKSLANIRLPKLQAPPLSGKAKDKNTKNQQKLNNFVDTHMAGTETNQDDDKQGQKKGEKDPELERIKDRFKQMKNSKDITNFFDQNSGTPNTENQNGQNTNSAGSNVVQATQSTLNIVGRQSESSKKDEELNKIYGGQIMKGLRSNTPKQNGGIIGLKPNLSAQSLQITPATTSSSIQQSFGMTAFSTKLGPKKNSIQSLQQKQLRLLDRQAYQNSNINNNNNNSNNNSNSQSKEDDNKQNGPLYISQYSHRTKAGCNYQGPKKNQDNFIIHPNLNKLPNRYLFCVCDGHGINGHDVSGFIRNTFPKILETLLAKDLMCLDEEYISSCLKLAFLQLSQKLLESRIDCTFSGSTFVCVLIIDDKIWCANTGDSRAIMCKQTKALWNSEPLSNDHKADDPEEKQRIEASGGRVDSYRDYNGDPVGPARVWMKFDDIPGLAMSRSFGDLIAAQCGVICEPEIKYFNIEEDDRFIVIASDGVWEFLNNRQVMVHVMPYYIRQQPDMACQKLVKEATNHWKQHDDVVDDITAICVFLHKNKPKLPQNKENEQEQSENPIQTIQQDDREEDESTIGATEKVEESIEKPVQEKIQKDHIEGTEDKSAGSRFNSTQQPQKKDPFQSSSQVTINMKQRKEQSLNKQKSNEANKNAPKYSTIIMKRDDNDIEESIDQHPNITELIKGGKQDKKVDSNKYDNANNKSNKNSNGKLQSVEGQKKPDSKNQIQNVDDSDDSEYSKDFELDREREKEQKNVKNNKDKAKNKEKSPFKGNQIQQYNFDEDDDDDDAFFKKI